MNNTHFVDLMLASLPKQLMNENMINNFNRIKPLTIDRFLQVAVAYGLPQPIFDLEGTKLKKK